MPPEVDVSGWSSSSLVPDNIKVGPHGGCQPATTLASPRVPASTFWLYSIYCFMQVKKSITLKPLPLVLTTTLSWNIESKAFTIKTSCKDSLFRGKVTLDVGAKAIQYRCVQYTVLIVCTVGRECTHS